MSEVLCRTPAGDIRRGDGLKYRRRGTLRGPLTATGTDSLHRWIYARDPHSRSRVIAVEEITIICAPPPDAKQRDITKPPRSKKGRRR